MTTVVLDAGHGGHDPGAVGNGLKEKDITLSLALKIGGILKKHGIKVTYTRSDDRFVDLKERGRISDRASADIFVSLHVNSAGNPAATGFEIWTSKGQGKGDLLATKIGEQLQKDFPKEKFRADFRDGDLDKESNFTVLVGPKAPAVLIEYLFIVNPSDANVLRTRQGDLAESTAKGIMSYLGIGGVKMDEGSRRISLDILGKKVQVEGVHKGGTNYMLIEGVSIPVRSVLEALGFKVTGKGKEVVAR